MVADAQLVKTQISSAHWNFRNVIRRIIDSRIIKRVLQIRKHLEHQVKIELLENLARSPAPYILGVMGWSRILL
jgi:hypothetical protein